jgi:hypothetical protein
MARRTRVPSETAPIVEARRGGPPSAADEQLNEDMQSALRQAAEVRETRARTRSGEDDRSYEHASAALQALIQGNARARTRVTR